jgi:CheY-like chemotaxis protein
LRQILINLLGNAVKFTPAGTVRLTVRSSHLGGEQWRISFEVSDTGIGIAAEDLPRIFDPFYQVAGRNSEGIGLGLAITRRLVEAMGGNLAIVSVPNAGTTFTLTLDVQGHAVEPARAERQVQGYAGRRRRVLVVDDKPDNRAVLAGWLMPLGFDVHEAGDGESAVAAVERLLPDAVLIDLVMPGVDGLAATARIRALRLPKEVRIVAVTANAFEETRRRSLAEGCDAFLTKPVDFTELRTTLGSLLGIDWQYAAPAPPAPVLSLETSAISVSAAQLGELHALAHAGDVMALEARVEALAAEPQHAAFAAELRSFVARMDLRGIERWLKPLLAQDEAK